MCTLRGEKQCVCARVCVTVCVCVCVCARVNVFIVQVSKEKYMNKMSACCQLPYMCELFNQNQINEERSRSPAIFPI